MKAILVTGGTAGIGQALVRHYYEEGWRVVTCGRDPERVMALQEALPGVRCVTADLATPEGRRALRDTVVQQVGTLDGIINNAAVQYSYHVASGEHHLHELEHELAVNLLAPIALGHLLLPSLSGTPAFIANVSSGLAYVPLHRAPVYCATKAALSHYTRSVRGQLPRVRWIEVLLPLVDTRMTAGRGRSKLSAADAARQIAAGIAHGRHTIRVGKAKLLPWLLWVAPALLARLMNRGQPMPHPGPVLPAA